MIQAFNIILGKNAFISLINSYVKYLFPDRCIPGLISWTLGEKHELTGRYNALRMINELKVEESCNITIEYDDLKMAVYNFLKIYCKDTECPSFQNVGIQINKDFSGATVSWKIYTSSNMPLSISSMTTTR